MKYFAKIYTHKTEFILILRKCTDAQEALEEEEK